MTHREIAKKNIINACDWIVGGYYNSLQDGDMEYLPESMEELQEEIYSSALENKYTGDGEIYGRAPKEMRFAGSEFCKAIIKEYCESDSDVQEIAEEMNWNVEKEEVKDFWENIPADCEKAIRELKRMKVFELLGFDFEATFADVWWLVLHEVDMYTEGYERLMRKNQAQTADRWLVRWSELATKYSLPDCYNGNRVFGATGIDKYSGQMI